MHHLDKIDWTSVRPNLFRIALADVNTYKNLAVVFAALSPILIFIFWPAFVLSLLLCVYFYFSYRKGQKNGFLILDFVIEKRERYERLNPEHYNPNDPESVNISSKIFYVVPKDLEWFELNENGLKSKNAAKTFERLVVYEFMYKKFSAGDRVSFIMTTNLDTIAYVLNQKVYYLETTKKLLDGSSKTISISLSQDLNKGKSYNRKDLFDYKHFINE